MTDTSEILDIASPVLGHPHSPNDQHNPSVFQPPHNGGTQKRPFIAITRLVKAYQTPAGEFVALNGLNLQIRQGEFVAVIGKSGSGKTTLINMLTGIDRPTSGEIYVGDAPLHTYNEEQMAAWRGRHLGIVFQFFQLLPTLTLVENVMLPMDINRLYPPKERRERAMHLLAQVELADQARKMPAAVSGGQQQRVAIARALANDPALLVADEPTGNLDSRTAETIFLLFERLATAGKTVIMVTHDESQAARVQRTVLIADGEVVNEHFVRALAMLDYDQLVEIRRQVEPITYDPGQVIIRQGEMGDRFYIITEGRADVLVRMPDGRDVIVDHLLPGRYFGEIALVKPGPRRATVRAAADSAVSVLALDRPTFDTLLESSPRLRTELQRIVVEHEVRLSAVGSKQ